MNTDKIGQILSLNLFSNEAGATLSEANAQPFIHRLQIILGVDILFAVLQSGLLSARLRISSQQLSNISKELANLRQNASKSDSNATIKIEKSVSKCEIPKSLSDELICSDIVVEMYTYLDNKSHSRLERTCRRLASIGRNPNANLYLGEIFESNWHSIECLRSITKQIPLWTQMICWNETMDLHKFSRLQKAMIVGDEFLYHRYVLENAESTISISQPLGSAIAQCLSKVSSLAVCATDLFCDDILWPKPTELVSNLELLSLRQMDIFTLAAMPSHLLGNGTLRTLELIGASILTLRNRMSEEHPYRIFFEWMIPSDESKSQYFNNLETLKIIDFPFRDFDEWEYSESIRDIINDRNRIASAFPKLSALVFIDCRKAVDSVGRQLCFSILNECANRIQSLHIDGTDFSQWHFSNRTDQNSKEFKYPKSVPFNLKEICCGDTLTIASLASFLNSNNIIFNTNLEKIALKMAISESIPRNAIYLMLMNLIDSKPSRKQFRLHLVIDGDTPQNEMAIVTDAIHSIYETIYKWFGFHSNIAEFTKEIVIQLRFRCATAMMEENLPLDRAKLEQLLYILGCGFKNFQLVVKFDRPVCDDPDEFLYCEAFHEITSTAKAKYVVDTTQDNWCSGLRVKSKNWDFVELVDGKWSCSCPNCEFDPFFS